MIQDNVGNILAEINSVLTKINQEECDILIQTILNSDKIVWVWAWKVWMATKWFIMRLWHFGHNAWFLWDTTVPHVWEWDTLLVVSWSWETQTIYDLVQIWKNNWAKIALITWNPDSRMWKLADIILKVTAPSKTKEVDWFKSIQPMTTLNEQSLIILFDALVLEMMAKTWETHDSMWWRHSNLE
ncbi:MAG: hypothetical protein ACD_3C00083G0020 [uncultured bacterium (gcode 4)]|uniref:SIS domain-containing protein n=1 Tax=uncultured bacterium (gcode 4) TaxID=1234023 RepID=K2FAX4_9BACT|nr:MAG: hypothetical protein ACD_3C00083G0020 [uncultured bacterium (gcode 4)]